MLAIRRQNTHSSRFNPILLPRDRPALGELDINKDLNAPRFRTKRNPIVFQEENFDAVVAGINDGVYIFDEVVELTEYRGAPYTAPPRRHVPESDEEEEVVEADAGAFEGEDISDNDLVEEFVEEDEEFVGDVMEEDLGEEYGEDHGHAESEDNMLEPVFDPAAVGLKEINNLAHFGVSSHKPGNGVAELLSDDTDKYWQSDGQQPHLLTIHFLRRVEIRAIRFYVDYNQDESYTPTNIVLYAGTGPHDLIQFADVALVNPVGWQDVPIIGAGGGTDGNSLCCWIAQMHVKENHQNGKDTHIRGIKIYGVDENLVGGGPTEPAPEPTINIGRSRNQATVESLAVDEEEALRDLLDTFDRPPLSHEGGFSNFPDFMREPEIR
ncbi:putative anaphase-promoting complex subunit 10 [Podospora australis]|uniref:Anaphase-promoting complex subunit 10 n=1 Tax=Podospora australis TaxID=1536484 RepID=A0AAN6WM21_9PEZI|nr:putative anaphase-promoting complex subunit 10 [Podospora australis]